MTRKELSDLFEKLCDTLQQSYYGVSAEFFKELDVYLKAGGKIEANDKNLLGLAIDLNHRDVADKLDPSLSNGTKTFHSPPLPVVYSKPLPLTPSVTAPSSQIGSKTKKLR